MENDFWKKLTELFVEEAKKPDIGRSPAVERVLGMTTLECERDLLMAKKKIVEFMKTDGLEPRREFGDDSGKPFLLRMPFTVAEQSGRRVRLGLSCNLPSIVVRSGKAELFAPGQELEVSVDIGYGQGEVVAKCYPIDCSNLELSDA